MKLVIVIACVALPASATAAPRTHDGLYLQLSIGAGYQRAHAPDAELGAGLGGFTVPVQIALGYSVLPGLALGAALVADTTLVPQLRGLSSNARTTELNGGALAIADYYPWREHGLHVQLGVGWGRVDVIGGALDDYPSARGLLVGTAVGYDFWVSPEWSIGVVARALLGVMRTNDASYTMVQPALLASFTYN
ncbi:MAG: hypothetical protein KC503_03195 [Myxococcales bacterium]|nr:hypothetical protein [Myxococcales bacterium]